MSAHRCTSRWIVSHLEAVGQWIKVLLRHRRIDCPPMILLLESSLPIVLLFAHACGGKLLIHILELPNGLKVLVSVERGTVGTAQPLSQLWQLMVPPRSHHDLTTHVTRLQQVEIGRRKLWMLGQLNRHSRLIAERLQGLPLAKVDVMVSLGCVGKEMGGLWPTRSEQSCQIPRSLVSEVTAVLRAVGVGDPWADLLAVAEEQERRFAAGWKVVRPIIQYVQGLLGETDPTTLRGLPDDDSAGAAEEDRHENEGGAEPTNSALLGGEQGILRIQQTAAFRLVVRHGRRRTGELGGGVPTTRGS